MHYRLVFQGGRSPARFCFQTPIYPDLGFNSVGSLVEDLEQQIEFLTLANQPSNHFHHVEQTVKSQQTQIQHLNETVENKSREIFKLHQSRLQFQMKELKSSVGLVPFCLRSDSRAKVCSNPLNRLFKVSPVRFSN